MTSPTGSAVARPADRRPRSRAAKITRALELASWLRDRGLSLSDLRQDLLEDWLSEGKTGTRWRIGEFIGWLLKRGVIGRLEVARPALREPTIAAPDSERLATVAWTGWRARAPAAQYPRFGPGRSDRNEPVDGRRKWNYLVAPDYARYVARRQRQDTVVRQVAGDELPRRR